MAVGLTPGQTLRILMPQAVRRMLPALISQLVVLLKDTSLGYVVAYPELLRQIRTLTEFFGNRYLFSLFIVAAVLHRRQPVDLAGRRLSRQRRARRRQLAVWHLPRLPATWSQAEQSDRRRLSPGLPTG